MTDENGNSMKGFVIKEVVLCDMKKEVHRNCIMKGFVINFEALWKVSLIIRVTHWEVSIIELVLKKGDDKMVKISLVWTGIIMKMLSKVKSIQETAWKFSYIWIISI